MPTYEYRCESCGNAYEKREGFDAPARQKCPACGKRAVRVLRAPSVVFKGSGFYATDQRGSDPSASSSTSDTSDKPAASATTPAAPDTASETAAAS